MSNMQAVIDFGVVTRTDQDGPRTPWCRAPAQSMAVRAGVLCPESQNPTQLPPSGVLLHHGLARQPQL